MDLNNETRLSSNPARDGTGVQVLTYRWYSWQDWNQPVDNIQPTIQIQVRAHRRGEDSRTRTVRLRHELRRALREVERELDNRYQDETHYPVPSPFLNQRPPSTPRGQSDAQADAGTGRPVLPPATE